MSGSSSDHVPRSGPVDREAIVARHAVRLTCIEPAMPLMVGNGRFGLTVDVTGLQTFPEAYQVAGGGTLLGTFAGWAGHSLQHPPGLGHIGLARIGGAEDLDSVEQWLDLWNGVIESRFTTARRGLRVTTAVHPMVDVVGVVIRAAADDPVAVRMRFPDQGTARDDRDDGTPPDAHTTVVETRGDWLVRRDLGRTALHIVIRAPRATLERTAEHELVFSRAGGLELSVGFGVKPVKSMPSAWEVFEASRADWATSWSSGAALDPSGTSDAEAIERERRYVRSRYLRRVSRDLDGTRIGLLPDGGSLP